MRQEVWGTDCCNGPADRHEFDYNHGIMSRSNDPMWTNPGEIAGSIIKVHDPYTGMYGDTMELSLGKICLLLDHSEISDLYALLHCWHAENPKCAGEMEFWAFDEDDEE